MTIPIDFYIVEAQGNHTMNLVVIVKQDKTLTDVKLLALSFLSSIGEGAAVIVDVNTQFDHSEIAAAADIENHLSTNDFFFLRRGF